MHDSFNDYDYWNNNYPQIDTVETKINQIKNAGYCYKSHFIAPVIDWTDNYHNPLQANLSRMLKKYTNNEVAKQAINILQTEINLYHKYCSEYSYVFYIMCK